MPLAAPVLSAAIRSQIMARPAIQAIDNDALTDLCDAIATAVVSHITAAGVVTVNVVTTCPAGAGTGAGGGTIT